MLEGTNYHTLPLMLSHHPPSGYNVTRYSSGALRQAEYTAIVTSLFLRVFKSQQSVYESLCRTSHSKVCGPWETRGMSETSTAEAIQRPGRSALIFPQTSIEDAVSALHSLFAGTLIQL